MYCVYHKIIHKKESHQDCIKHGHCLYPSGCPLFAICPLYTQIYKDVNKDIDDWIKFFKS